ncbi:MAG: urea carboxylase-associated family protein, partial [Gemmobacter sp.]|nr:urea carboxylase-associated family protein [Gemmobacter sp.]
MMTANNPNGIHLIPARKGVAARAGRGQIISVINTHGSQVVDTWAFRADDLSEFMSMEHSRGAMLKVNPVIGDALRSNRRRPMLTLVEDTSGGIHDTMIAACDRYRYEQLGHVGHHDNCTDNLAAALT